MSRARDLADSADNDITGTLTVDDITLSGSITVGGTVDGRDIAADGTKLDGVEANATADQTKADIDALNINADTLDGQHGSYYTSYADTAVANLVDSAPGTLDTLNELAAALGDDPNFSTTVTNNIATKLPLAGGTMTGAITFAAGQTFDGRDVSADGSKLDGIESGATADQTASEILTAIKTVDGAGSGLDADTLDGSHASAFASASHSHGKLVSSYSGVYTNADSAMPSTIRSFAHDLGNGPNDGHLLSMTWGSTTGYGAQIWVDTDPTGNMAVRQRNGSGTWTGWYNIWTSGNDGSGSGLDADLLDGVDGSNYARTDQFEYFSSGFQVVSSGPSLGKVQNQNLKVTGTSGSSDCGITGYGGDGNWDFQLYGYNGQQGFLKSNWGPWAVYTDTSGNWTATGNVTAYSDERLKDNIEVIDNAVDKVMSIRGVTYNRNDDEDYVRQAGVIAQEVEKVLPEVVQENSDGIKTVAYGNMVGLLVEAIKELKAEIEELKNGPTN